MFREGEKYLIRTVTNYVVGVVKQVGDKELLVGSASWVADTGRFHDALKNGGFREVEPYLDDVIVGRGAIVDATVWRHDLPTAQK